MIERMLMNPIHKTQPLDFSKVRIDDRFWKPRLETNRKVTIPLEYRICKKTGRIDAWNWKPGRPFRPHIFWDSDLAKWMEASAYTLAVHPDRSLEKKLDAVIAMMAKAQLPDGYLNSHYIRVEPDKRWTNLRDCHELYCAGHLMEAAAAYFQATGKRRFLDIMCRYADHIEATFGREPGKKRGYCGHEEIELALIKLYKATRNPRYLKLSKYFIDERGRRPHYFDHEARLRGDEKKPSHGTSDHNHCQAHSPVRKQTVAEGHAVRAMYLYSGMADVAAETGDETLLRACHALWQNMTERRMYITGGIGSYARDESFSFDYDLPNEEAYAETCAAISLVFWASRMSNLEPDRRYADVMERALYNGVLSGISLDGKHFFYGNPLAVSPAKYRFVQRIGQAGGFMGPTRQRWFDCACCPPNAARLLASLGEYLYSLNDREIYVHLYVQSRAEMTVAGKAVTLVQKTNYPRDGKIKITIQPSSGVSENKKINFTLALRIPAWCRNYGLRVNGKSAKVPVSSCGYVKLARDWQFGNEIELTLPMPVEEIEAHPGVRHNCGRVALQRGPLVYCLEETDNGPELNDLALLKNPHWKIMSDRQMPGGIPVITGQAVRRSVKLWKNRLYQPVKTPREKTAIKAVPYCLWNNRGMGEMLVWIRKTR